MAITRPNLEVQFFFRSLVKYIRDVMILRKIINIIYIKIQIINAWKTVILNKMLNTVFDTMKFEPYRQPKQTDSEITVG